jgi:hypothetical protein
MPDDPNSHRFTNNTHWRRFWTGIDDDHLASVAFANYAWNIVERKFASLVWIAADWPQKVGELVTADLGNVSVATLFINLVKQSIIDDDRIVLQATKTVALVDSIRGERNDLIHSFFHHDPVKKAGLHIKLSAKPKSGEAEIKIVTLSKDRINEMLSDLSICYDSIDDISHKITFRRFYLTGKMKAYGSYDNAVHGWREPSFDIELLRTCLRRRSQRQNPPQGQPQPQS